MSNSSFESVENTLRNLKDIVERNHSQSTELVQNMEHLVAEIKTKTSQSNLFSKLVEPPSIVIHNPTAIRV